MPQKSEISCGPGFHDARTAWSTRAGFAMLGSYWVTRLRRCLNHTEVHRTAKPRSVSHERLHVPARAGLRLRRRNPRVVRPRTLLKRLGGRLRGDFRHAIAGSASVIVTPISVAASLVGQRAKGPAAGSDEKGRVRH